MWQLYELRNAYVANSNKKMATTIESRRILTYSTVILTLYMLTWRIWRAPNNASKWQMGFNSAFKGLIYVT
jgi:hypothetical protein